MIYNVRMLIESETNTSQETENVVAHALLAHTQEVKKVVEIEVEREEE